MVLVLLQASLSQSIGHNESVRYSRLCRWKMREGLSFSSYHIADVVMQERVPRTGTGERLSVRNVAHVTPDLVERGERESHHVLAR